MNAGMKARFLIAYIYISVGIATGYGLDGRDSIPAISNRASLVHNAETDAGSGTVCYAMGTEVVFPGSKRRGREADHSPPSSAEANNVATIFPLPHTPPGRGV
jgi:hypothetical protein